MRLQFIGSGDAFGSGGRFNTCFHVIGDQANFLIDCGASSLIPLKINNVDRNSIRTIFITHFHSDHFGGIPFFVLRWINPNFKSHPTPHQPLPWMLEYARKILGWIRLLPGGKAIGKLNVALPVSKSVSKCLCISGARGLVDDGRADVGVSSAEAILEAQKIKMTQKAKRPNRRIVFEQLVVNVFSLFS